MRHRLEGARGHPAPGLVVDRVPRREVARQEPPRRTGPHDPPQRVVDRAEVVPTLPSLFGKQHQVGRRERPLLLSRAGRIRIRPGRNGHAPIWGSPRSVTPSSCSRARSTPSPKGCGIARISGATPGTGAVVWFSRSSGIDAFSWWEAWPRCSSQSRRSELNPPAPARGGHERQKTWLKRAGAIHARVDEPSARSTVMRFAAVEVAHDLVRLAEGRWRFAVMRSGARRRKERGCRCSPCEVDVATIGHINHRRRNFELD
jgi:hypothetical protein